MKPVIETHALCKSYHGRPVVDHLNLTVPEGCVYGFLGPNGAGKSTMLNAVAGVWPVDSGKIIIDGRDLWAEPEKIRDFRFLTGLVFQYPEYQLFEETCYKDIAFGP